MQLKFLVFARWPVECSHVLSVSASHLIELALIFHSFVLPACPFRQRDDLVVLRLRTKKGEYIMTPGTIWFEEPDPFLIFMARRLECLDITHAPV